MSRKQLEYRFVAKGGYATGWKTVPIDGITKAVGKAADPQLGEDFNLQFRIHSAPSGQAANADKR